MGENPGRWVESRVPSIPLWLGRFRRDPFYSAADALAARWLFKQFKNVADEFAPDAVLSVMMPDPLFHAAAYYSRQRRLPLVLVCHDDYLHHAPKGYDPQVRRIYQQAAVRLCVSEPMAENFRLRYGVEAMVLHPVPSGPAGAVREQCQSEPLVVGFAGSLGDGYEKPFLMLADALHRRGGRLAIASPTSREILPRLWTHPAVHDLGFLAPEQVSGALMKEGANVLAVVQSYAPSDSHAFKHNFPSKLTEYATFGLPLLVVAPEGSSAAIWTRQNPGSALLVENLSDVECEMVISNLQNADSRKKLAQGFHEAAKVFEPQKLQGIFEEALLRACSLHGK